MGLLLSACATQANREADLHAALAERARRYTAAANVQVGMPERRVRELMGAPDNIRVAYLPQSRHAAIRTGYAYTYVLDPALPATNAAPSLIIFSFSNERVVTNIERRGPTNTLVKTMQATPHE